MNDNLKPAEKVRVIDSVWTLIVAIALVGPMALPLLWRNPRFSKKSKIFWSMVTVAITILCVFALKWIGQFTAEQIQALPH